jgi:phenylalanyl-tRNA synthetase beta subunit
MSLQNITEKAIAESIQDEKAFLLIVQPRSDGTAALFRVAPEKLDQIIGKALQVPEMKESLKGVKLAATSDGKGNITLTLGGKGKWQT